MKIIVAVDEKWGIGKKNGLLFSIKEDMRHFMKHTMNKVVVMGSNTLLSFPESKPLKNRTNVVLWPGGAPRDDCLVVQNLEELSSVLKGFETDDVFVVGGAMFYRTMLPFCDTAYITKVHADGGAEVFFENLDELPGWTLTEVEPPVDNGEYVFEFCEYKNCEPKLF